MTDSPIPRLSPEDGNLASDLKPDVVNDEASAVTG